MKRDYGSCHTCGGKIEEQLQTRELRSGEKLIIVEDTPTGVCTKCGQWFIHPAIGAELDRLVHSHAAPDRRVEVPIYKFERKVA